MNIFEILENFFYTLIDYGRLLWNLVNSTVSLGGIEFNFLLVLGTGFVITLIIWRLIKEFVL